MVLCTCIKVFLKHFMLVKGLSVTQQSATDFGKETGQVLIRSVDLNAIRLQKNAVHMAKSHISQ